jgi:hypothetical protein
VIQASNHDGCFVISFVIDCIGGNCLAPKKFLIVVNKWLDI